jgi:AcrR family transcriptional regulator
MLRSLRRKRLGQYHHGDLRRAIIDEALKVIDEQGVTAVTTRELARRLGVSHAAPGHHFADREALLAEVATEGFHLFADALEHAVAAVSDPAERFVALGSAYLRFAFDHPSYLRVMFTRGFPKGYRPSDQFACESDRAYSVLEGVVRDLTVALGGDPTPLDELAYGAWSLVHGMAMLWIDGATTYGFVDREGFEATAARVVRRAISGLIPRGPTATLPASLVAPAKSAAKGGSSDGSVRLRSASSKVTPDIKGSRPSRRGAKPIG